MPAHHRALDRSGEPGVDPVAGKEEAWHIKCYAQTVENSGEPGDEEYHAAVSDFDFMLRSDGHRRNPGTTADLIAAALFALLRDGKLQPPRYESEIQKP